MRRGLTALALTGTILIGTAGAASGAEEESRPVVSGVELVAPAALPEQLIRRAIGEMIGRPRSRQAIRQSIERTWALGLFDDIWVEEVAEAGGVRLRYHLELRPLVRRITWRGDAGLDVGQLVGAAALAVGEEASPARLGQVRNDLLALYEREGYLDAQVDIEATGNGPARDVVIKLAAGTPARLDHVRIEGTLGLPADVVTRTLALRAGDRYRESLVRDRVRALEERLRRDGFFTARVTSRPPVRDAGPGTVDLTIDVAAGPRYEVIFDGRAELAESDLRRRLTFNDSGVVDAFEVEASARQLEVAYRERGYAAARVTGALDEAATPPTIRFRIAEGPQARVASVTVRGNVALTTGQLEAAIATRPSTLVRAGLFRQDVLDRDLAALQALAQAEGFTDATIGPAELRWEDGGRRVHVVIPVVEGPRLTVDDVVVEGQTLFTPAELLGAIRLRAGEPWNLVRAEDGRRSVERLYGRRGYHGATVDMKVNRHGRQISLAYHVAEGGPTHVGRILRRGLVVTRDDTILRQLGIRPGDLFDPDRLTAARQRLEQAPAFATVDVGPLRPTPTPFADLDVTVAEQKPWHLELGAGYDTAVGGRGFLDLGHDNLFGTARSASLRMMGSIGGEAIHQLGRVDLVYREPWIVPGTPWQAEASLFGEVSENQGYDLQKIGLLTWIGDDLLNPRGTRTVRSRLRYRLEASRLSDVSRELQAQGVEPGTERIASLMPTVVWDLRDDRFNPRRGSVHQASVELATTGLGGTVDFVKSELSTAWFFSWLPPTVLALSGRLGLAGPFGGTGSLPIQDRFFAGGGTSVRGFPENKLGPLDAAGDPVGGNALVVVSAEWRFPIWRWLGGAVFIDAGAVTPEVGDLELSAFKSGAGAGLRVTTPVGPIRLDVGYALQPIPDESRTQVYVTVGFPF
jgi:outer membrane protein insertion porin family